MKFLTTEGWKEIELSPWAKYVAQDESGSWIEVSGRPFMVESFVHHSVWMPLQSHEWGFLCHGPKPKDWTQELYEVY